MPKRLQRDAPEPGEGLALAKQAELLLGECRMVLPGIEGLFGFQLIAVFSEGFAIKLEPFEQNLHVLAIALVLVAVVLVMAPAAYHRQTGGREITESFINISTRLMLFSMWPLAIATCIDFYLVSRIVLDATVALSAVTALLVVFVSVWFVLPRSTAFQHLLGARKRL